MAVGIHPTNAASARNGSIAVPRWGALIGGGALALLGLSRRSRSGLALAAGGGLLAYMGARAAATPAQAVARSSVLVNCSPQEAFQFWRNFENLPLFMRHIDSVTIIDNRRSRWIAAGPLGKPIEWEAEIVAERADELISWRSLADSDIQVDGFVEFRPATGKRGTVISANIIYSPPAGRVGHTIAKLLGKDPSFLMKNDLRRLKALIEAGEIPTVEGQPHGPRSKVIGVVRMLSPDESMRGQVRLGEFAEAKRRLA
jgi:uncharacterized membrane protein